MDPLLSLLHFAGGTFPTGAFSQSWGLETYISNEKVKNEEDFRAFLDMYIGKMLGGLEGPIFCAAYDLAEEGKMEQVSDLGAHFLAMCLTKESREATLRTGKAFLRIVAEISADQKIAEYYQGQKQKGITFPIAFALVCARQETGKKAALEGYMFSTVNGLVQSGLKLIPLGNAQAQRLLLELYGEIEMAVDKALHIPRERAFAFCPGLDIASMHHETLQTRLYMT